jgi:hypothetical protein
MAKSNDELLAIRNESYRIGTCDLWEGKQRDQ